MTDEEKVDIVALTFRALYDNWIKDGDFKDLLKRLQDRLELSELEGLLWERVVNDKGLNIHNALQFANMKLTEIRRAKGLIP